MDNFLTKIKNRDEEALQKLYNDYVKLVYHIAYAYSRNKQDAEDITIEVFNKVIKNISKYEDNGKLKEWISMIARNESCNHVTRNKNTNEVLDDTSVGYAKANDNNHNEMIDLFERFLDEETKNIMILRFIYNYSFKEIAKLLNKTLGQIQGLYYDGIEKLKQEVTR